MNIKQNIYPGQIVELFPIVTHEGPHADDFDALTRYAIVAHVHRHPANAQIVDGYDVIELDAHDSERPARYEFLTVRSIARVSTKCPHRERVLLELARSYAQRNGATFTRERPVVF